MLTQRARRNSLGTEVRRFTDSQGNGFRIMKYRLKEPGYRTADCTATPRILHIEALSVFFGMAIESELFRRVLDSVLPGCSAEILGDHEYEFNWQGPGGRQLEEVMRWFSSRDLSAALLRSADIQHERDLEKFLWSIRKPEAVQEMAELGRLSNTEKDKTATRELGAAWKKHGLRLKPYQVPADASNDRKRLGELILGTAGGYG